MSAQDHLNQTQFFHGTPEKLQPGDMIEPGHESNYHDGNRAGSVFACRSSLRASQWAHDAINAREELGRESRGNTPRVYEVKPTGPVYEDWENEDAGDVVSQHPMQVLGRVVYYPPTTTAQFYGRGN